MLAGAFVSGALGAVLLGSAIVRGAAASRGEAAESPATHPTAPAARPAPTTRAVARPAPTGPCGRTTGRTVVVSIRAQHLWACERARPAFDSPVTTGAAGDGTPTGTFTVSGRTADTVLRPETGETYRVRYWVPFIGDEYGFHDSPWQQIPYGSAQYRTGGSHGCVHVPPAAMARLYTWAPPGTSVTIS